ncbi:MAG: hypothetical protein FJ221_04055 [Lentisphaerae bacterium]|nr:hypothetical protein [Lentisphaerota bacterium]
MSASSSLFAVGCWLLAVGCWLLVVGVVIPAPRPSSCAGGPSYCEAGGRVTGSCVRARGSSPLQGAETGRMRAET